MEDNPAYEYGVTLGQAHNLAFELVKGSPRPPDKSQILSIFQMLLDAKLDPAFRNAFGQYLEDKKAVQNGTVVGHKNRGKEDLPIIQIKAG